MEKLTGACRLCPRECGAERGAGKFGVCGAGGSLRVARAALHYYEEPCLSGTRGSGAVFFSGCPLGCAFCQNAQISRGNVGKDITVDRLSEIFLELAGQGALNINLVTAGHFAPLVAEAVDRAKAAGLKLPVVWNCSGYESVETLRLLEGRVDVYLPDFKYVSERLAVKYSRAPGYFAVAKAALAEMFRQTGRVRFRPDGSIRRGVIVRHLMLPGCLFDSKKVVDYVYRTYGDSVILSVMSQYTPMGSGFAELERELPPSHYRALVDYAAKLGVKKAYVQKGRAALKSFIPDFDGTGV